MAPAASTPTAGAATKSAAAVAALKRISHGDLAWGSVATDNMLVAKWTKAAGWGASEVVSVADGLRLSPATSALHYGTSIFEGMKLYAARPAAGLSDSGMGALAAESGRRAALFRPHFHAARLNASAARMALPTVDEDLLLDDIARLVRHERDAGWLPAARGTSLYIRPLLFASEASLGVRRSNEATLVVTCHPVGSYFSGSGSPKSLRLLVDPAGRVRAWPGGVGFAKTGGGYAASIAPADEAKNSGYDTVLWTGGEERIVGECGQMNFFWIRCDKSTGRRVLCTPELDGTILAGANRDSILKIAIPLGIAHEVQETRTPLMDLTRAIDSGEVVEMFGSGTAAIVVPVKSITADGVEHAAKEAEEAGDASAKIRSAMMNIHHQEDGHLGEGWMFDIDEPRIEDAGVLQAETADAAA